MILFYGCDEMIIELPVGNTDPQPTEIPNHTVRINHDTLAPEVYYDGEWRTLTPISKEVKQWMRFGFTLEEAENLIKFNKYLKPIPVSFLVQINMGIFRDGMDRRRP